MITNRKIVAEFLHLFAFVGFAIAQPVYDLLGKYPEFIIAHRASPLLIISMIFMLTIGLAFVLILIEVVSLLLGERVQKSLHLLFVLGLTLLVAMQFTRQLVRAFDLFVITLAMIIALFFTILYVRWKPARNFMTVLVPIVLLFPLWFLWSTPVGSFILSDNTSTNVDPGQDSAPVIEIKNPVPIIVVVFDEFSTAALLDAEEKIDTIRYPNFAALASESLWFPNAVGPTVDTAFAVPAIMTGKQPNYKAKLTPTATDHPNSIFSLLGEQYELNVFETMTAVCPDTLCPKEYNLPAARRYASFFADIAVIYLHVIAPPNLGRQLPTLDGQWTGFGMEFLGLDPTNGEDVVNQKYAFDQFQKHKHIDYFLSKIHNKYMPAFHFIHVALPHIPYWYLSSGHQYSKERKLPEGIISDKVGWIGEDSLIITAYHQYLHQVGYVDRFVGNLVKKLRSERLYDKALIILTSDHGVSFQFGRSRRLSSEDTAKEIIKVPMIMKLPGQREGQIDERLVSGIDVLPTIIDVLGAEVNWEMDGISMISDEKMTRKEIDIPLVGCLTAEELKGFSRLEWQIEYFGMYSSLDQLVPKGPYNEVLLHKEIASLNVSQTVFQCFSSEDIDSFKNVDMQSGFLPAQLRGYVTGADKRNLSLAIALNGRIWTTTKTSKWNGKRNYFNVLIPPAAFKDGYNKTDVYLIKEKGGELLLSLLDDGRKNIVLEHNRSGKLKILFPNNQKVDVVSDPAIMKGSLDWVSFDGSKLYFEGWAANIKKKQQVKSILIFTEEQLVGQIEPNYKRKGVNELFQLKPSLLSGFRGGFLLDILKLKTEKVRVVALGQNKVAVELPLKWKHKKFIQSLVDQKVANK